MSTPTDTQPRRTAPLVRAEFHALMVAAIATGMVLAFSASDLGPFAPMLIALGLCAVLFGVLGESLLVFGHLLGRSMRRKPANGVES